ncbi:uncharacterized protein LOC128219873 [Mya arenaria]|uniref:uncharacterized protein LOC128219873 n=1 Tax=Mya arenaria TaxID=6604 RepID=UPI0022E70F8F|nr:uncharacterized protein LOC128219873 [Mya arenaria]
MASEEFPGVIELSVGGTHTFTTLLSTLTKHEGSRLADMFSWRADVHKDKDGRYFIDVDGSTFDAILDYLKFGTLPAISVYSNYGSGLFGGGFNARPGQLTSLNYRPDEIRRLHASTVSLGLKELAKHLEECFPVLVRNKLDYYRNTKDTYDECLKSILESISPEALLLKDQFTVRVRHQSRSPGERCCEHECVSAPQQSSGFGNTGTTGFGFSNRSSPIYSDIINTEVSVPFDVDCTLLACLSHDLIQRGFNVQGRETFCGIECKKHQRNQSNQSSFVFRGIAYCCRETLFILHFTWSLDRNMPNQQQPLFGNPKSATSFAFGQQQTQQEQQPQQQQSLFGQQQQQQRSGFNFGASPNASATPASGSFGGFDSSQQATGFGALNSTKSQKSLFGGPQSPQKSVFGGATTGTSPFGQASAFGLKPASTFGQPSPQGQVGSKSFEEERIAVGKGSPSQQQKMGGFGSPAAFYNPLGNAQTPTSVSQVSFGAPVTGNLVAPLTGVFGAPVTGGLGTLTGAGGGLFGAQGVSVEPKTSNGEDVKPIIKDGVTKEESPAHKGPPTKGLGGFSFGSG